MINLKPVDAVEVISIVDNLLEPPGVPGRADVKGFREWTPNPERARSPRAEHGLSMLVRVQSGDKTHAILLDVAYEPGSVLENAERMGLDLTPVEAIVLSHQHYDHTGGLIPVLTALNAKDLPLIVHPNAFTRRGWRDPAKPGAKMRQSLPTPTREEATAAGARIVEAAGPYLLGGDAILVTGEIPRITDFEMGMPFEWILDNGEWRHDPRVLDDRSIVMNVRGRGLVVISGCAHAGIINTVRYARELTGVQRVAAIIGGFHLTGDQTERIIAGTVAAMMEMQPELLVPSHCTGWRGRMALAQAFPSAFVPNIIGNMYRIGD
jgi:7,8-dihydropterin-6-yl-methyl-4-(beta-D-ribofuranosyl)aminobenzene 5'-phosphate synthase